jgi:hypothetical protein
MYFFYNYSHHLFSIRSTGVLLIEIFPEKISLFEYPGVFYAIFRLIKYLE